MAERNVTKTLTRNESMLARMQCAGVSIHWCNEWREYSVKLAGEADATAFCSDKQEALDTALHMTGYKLALLQSQLLAGA